MPHSTTKEVNRHSTPSFNYSRQIKDPNSALIRRASMPVASRRQIIDKLPIRNNSDVMINLTSAHNPRNRLYYTLGSTSIRNSSREKIIHLSSPINVPKTHNLALSGYIYTKLSQDGKVVKIKFVPDLYETLAKFKKQSSNLKGKILENPIQFIQDNQDLLALIIPKIIDMGKKLLKDKQFTELKKFITRNPAALISLLANKNFIVPVALSLSPIITDFIKACRPFTLATYDLPPRRYKLIT